MHALFLLQTEQPRSHPCEASLTHISEQRNLPEGLSLTQEPNHVVVLADDAHAALADDVHLQAQVPTPVRLRERVRACISRRQWRTAQQTTPSEVAQHICKLFKWERSPEDGLFWSEHDELHAQGQVCQERLLQIKKDGDLLQVLLVSKTWGEEG